MVLHVYRIIRVSIKNKLFLNNWVQSMFCDTLWATPDTEHIIFPLSVIGHLET
jgi:hypothetical protein